MCVASLEADATDGRADRDERAGCEERAPAGDTIPTDSAEAAASTRAERFRFFKIVHLMRLGICNDSIS